jgi:hypothetical protein
MEWKCGVPVHGCTGADELVELVHVVGSALCRKLVVGQVIYRMPQKLRSLLRDLIPQLILSQKRHIHMGPICNGSVVMSF